MTVTIDVATKIITPDQKIWLVHAGKGKKYYEIFKRQNIVFLDMPGLDLTLESLTSVEKIRQHVRMAEARRKYHFSDEKLASAPSKNPSTYESGASDDVRGDVGNIQGLFASAKQGDLVLVTGRGPFESILIGEISDEFNPEDTLTLEKKPYASVQYRKVKWVSTKYAKKDFGQEIAEKKLVNRKAVVNIERNNLTESIYKYAYRSYFIIRGDNDVVQNLAKVDFMGHNYSGHDPRATRSSIDLISYLEAAFIAFERGQIEEFSQLPFKVAMDNWADGDLIQSFSQEFNSPGRFRMLSYSLSFCAFMTMGVSALTSAKIASFMEGAEIHNSVSSDQVSKEIFQSQCERVQELLNSLGQDKLCELEAMGNDAKNRIGLKTQVDIKSVDEQMPITSN